MANFKLYATLAYIYKYNLLAQRDKYYEFIYFMAVKGESLQLLTKRYKIRNSRCTKLLVNRGHKFSIFM